MKPLAIALTLAAASPAMAADLFTASGSWTGDGKLATGVNAPLERGRCRVNVTPSGNGNTVDVIGDCAVAVGRSDFSLKLVRGGGGSVSAGAWTAATGNVVQYAGRESSGKITLQSTSQVVVDGVGYDSRVDVSWPSEGSFLVRQFLRGQGETSWRLLADITYRKSGG